MPWPRLRGNGTVNVTVRDNVHRIINRLHSSLLPVRSV